MPSPSRKLKIKYGMKVQPSSGSKRRTKQREICATCHQQESDSTEQSAFDRIASTFGFSHHKGTSHELELSVLKNVLVRETIIDKLQSHVRNLDGKQRNDDLHINKKVTALEQNVSKRAGKNILEKDIFDLLSDCRDVTARTAISIMIWRQSQEDFEYLLPSLQMRPFIWRSQSYMSKMIHDTDFIMESPLFDVESVPIKNNPLMLPNSLDRARKPDQWFQSDPPTIWLTRDNSVSNIRMNASFETAEGVFVLETYMKQDDASNDVISRAIKLLKNECCIDREVHQRLDKSFVTSKKTISTDIKWQEQAKAQLLALKERPKVSKDVSTKKTIGTARQRCNIPREISCVFRDSSEVLSLKSNHSAIQKGENYSSILAPPRGGWTRALVVEEKSATDNKMKV